jgi:hypothetical protein
MILYIHLIANLDNDMKLQELLNDGLPAHAWKRVSQGQIINNTS